MSTKPAVVDPVSSRSTFERVDQGVDYSQTTPYDALAAGTVVGVCHGCFAGGTDTAVYIRLAQPITINGRTYRDAYYAETTPLVKVGEHVAAGQPVTAGGAAELGFANDAGNAPAAPLIGGLGAGTQPTQAGRDFAALIGGSPAAPATVATPSSSSSSSSSSSGGGLFGGLESWLADTGKLVLAYLVLVGLAAGLFLTGSKGLGVKAPKIPRPKAVPA